MSNDVGSIINGFRFQIDAAVYFFVKYLSEIEKIGIEKNEDTHVLFCNGEMTYVQSKAVKTPFKTDADSGKLKKAIESLKTHNIHNIRHITYNTNQYNPITTKNSSFTMGQVEEVSIHQLSHTEVEKIKRYIEDTHPLYDKILIFKLPYEVSDDVNKTREYILKEIGSKLKQMQIYQGISRNLMNTWHSLLENSGVAGNYISKERFTWIIIANLLDVKLLSCQNDIKNSHLISAVFSSIISDFKTENLIRSIYIEYIVNNPGSSIDQFVNDDIDKLENAICLDESNKDIQREELILIVKKLFELENDIKNTKRGAGIL